MWPLAEYVLDQPERVSKVQSGNAQSLPVVMAWQLYVFCNTAKRETPVWKELMSPEHGESSESEAGDLDDNAATLSL